MGVVADRWADEATDAGEEAAAARRPAEDNCNISPKNASRLWTCSVDGSPGAALALVERAGGGGPGLGEREWRGGRWWGESWAG